MPGDQWQCSEDSYEPDAPTRGAEYAFEDLTQGGMCDEYLRAIASSTEGEVRALVIAEGERRGYCLEGV